MDQGVAIKKQSQIKEIFKRFKRNRMAVFGLVVIILLILCALFPSVIAPYGYDDQNLSEQFIAPRLAHPFGTDNFGRDILSRVIYG